MNYNSDYRKGYFKAYLDIYNILESRSENMLKLKSPKKILALIQSILKLSLTDPSALDAMLDYGETVNIYVKNGTATKIKPHK